MAPARSAAAQPLNTLSSTAHQPGALPLADGDLIQQLQAVRDDLLAFERDCADWLAPVQPHNRDSARNLLHVIAFHRHDHPGLQRQLRERGLSSLEACDGHLLASLNAVLARLAAGQPPAAAAASPSHGLAVELLQQRCEQLFGAACQGQANAIMVTLPAAAADHPSLIQELVEAGMGMARINCAHDGPQVWQALVARVRQAASNSGRHCLVSMDLGGPKLRTGPLPEEPGVVDARPQRDRYGRLLQPALILALAPGREPPQAQAGITPLPVVSLPGSEPEHPLAAGERFSGRDASGRVRELILVERRDDGLLLGCRQHCRFTTGLRFRRQGGGGDDLEVAALPPCPGELLLRVGDTLELTAGAQSAPAGRGRPSISCTLPEVFVQLRAGERVLFDDGKLAGVIRRVSDQALTIAITEARPRGSRLRADKAIHVPGSALQLPALTARDREDLAFATARADIVNYSFVSRPSDVEALQRELEALGAGAMGVVLKIDTRQAVASLPRLLLTAMGRPQPLGVMIAHGDLALECGWDALASIQEEILRVCAAAHVPFIWASRVLEAMANHGSPPR